jgi:hypothetical protein
LNDENTGKLFSSFPTLYQSHQLGFMSRGFECDDEWFDLIYTLSKNLEVIARNIESEKTTSQWLAVTQVKEKFGSLRFRWHILATKENVQADAPRFLPLNLAEPRISNEFEAIRQLITDAKNKSLRIGDH